MKFYQIFKELTRILLKLFQKITESNTSKFTFKASVTQTPKSDKDITQKKKIIGQYHFIVIKILNKVLANHIQQHIKKIIHHGHMGFIPGMQGWFNIHKSIHVKYSINKLKNKNHLNECRNTFNKIQHPYMI